MDKLIDYGPTVRNKIVAGAKMLEDVVASTLGPAGHNVIISDGGVRPVITKDGATVSNSVDSEDPYMKIGIQMVKDVVSKVDALAGDGTTTTTVYTAELMKQFTDLVNLGVNPNELRKGLEAATKDAVVILEKEAYHTDDVAAVANLATNGDAELTKLLVEAYSAIGENGSVILADSWKRSGESYVEVSTGIKWAGGIPSEVFITNPIESTAVLDDPYIMVFASGITDLEPLKPYIDLSKKEGRNLVLIAPYFEPAIWTPAAGDGVCLIMSPGKSLDRLDLHEALMDLAITVGTKVIPDAESAIKVVPDLKDLGVAKLIVASVEETNITQVDEMEEAKAEEYEKYLQTLKAKIDDDDELRVSTVERLKERLARLSGGIATIHIGALTPTEKEEKVALVEDAQNSVGCALKFGVLPGGGTALLKTAQMLAEAKHEFSSDAMRKGYEAVLNVMRIPSKKLVGSIKPDDYQYLVQQVAHDSSFWKGYNIRTEQIEDLKKSKIFDSAAIEIFAMKYAASEVGSFIISDGVVINAVDNIRYDMNDRRAAEAGYVRK